MLNCKAMSVIDRIKRLNNLNCPPACLNPAVSITPI
jgi:hypothetical protein